MGTIVWDAAVPVTRTERARRAANFAVVLIQFYAAAATGRRLHA